MIVCDETGSARWSAFQCWREEFSGPSVAVVSGAGQCFQIGASQGVRCLWGPAAQCELVGRHPRTCWRRSRRTHRSLSIPRTGRAPSMRLGPQRSRRATNTPSTNSRLPSTAPSAKYRTRKWRYSGIDTRPRAANTARTASRENPRRVDPQSGAVPKRSSPCPKSQIR